MSLALDARRRAMLEEMGVRVWLPAARTALAPAPSGSAATREPAAAPPAVAVATRAPLPDTPVTATGRGKESAVAPAGVDMPGLRAASPQALYPAEDRSGTGGWLVVADMPPGPDGRHGGPLDGDAGRLLDQMLRALQLHRGDAPVHLVRVHRAAPGAPATGDDADFDSAFGGWATPLAPRIVLAMGPLSAQRLLGRQEPLGRLRGQPQPCSLLGEGVQVVATYHPAYLLRSGGDKARAWADLCLAAARYERRD